MKTTTQSHAAAAAEWMAAHPQAMTVFRDLARRCVERRRRIGISALVERVRWEFSIERHDGEEFKVNNNYAAYIARELIATVPGFAPLIQTRIAEGDSPCLN